jgi:hypothetical protein
MYMSYICGDLIREKNDTATSHGVVEVKLQTFLALELGVHKFRASGRPADYILCGIA